MSTPKKKNKKRYQGIDYEWRPASYWAESKDVLGALLRDIKGTNRRELIRDFSAADIAEDVEPDLLQQSLTEEQRRGLGMIHPSCMGGEYLPDYGAEETEIARIELQSTTSDVISIRARPAPGEGRIAYAIYDEYDSEFAFSPVESDRPLTLGELVAFIDGAQQNPEEDYCGPGLGLCYNAANFEAGADAEGLRHFTSVNSDLYAALFEHYDRVHDDWVRGIQLYADAAPKSSIEIKTIDGVQHVRKRNCDSNS